MSKQKIDKPSVSGLPGQRKRPHAYGAPSVAEFYTAIANAKRRRAAGRARQ
jgi:hypothetical protein